MKRFECPECGAELHFDSFSCVRCGTKIGYRASLEVFEPVTAEVTPCANRDVGWCNWLVENNGSRFCPACRHNRTVPDTRVYSNVVNWRRIEVAKRYLFYSILKWRLPHPTRAEADNGLAFDFLADSKNPDGTEKRVMTGHANGLITLNLAEGDDAVREARRTALGEPYRTLIGHMRHEVGHYYWEVLVRQGGWLDECRAVFGDDTEDYGAALKRHYHKGPPKDWKENFISSYASAHPWEDFAETWAHYIHIVDASETAHAFGMALKRWPSADAGIEIGKNPYYGGTLAEIVEDWVPLTVAMNCLNRSMGLRDIYPFVLKEKVRHKLGFMHELIRAIARQ